MNAEYVCIAVPLIELDTSLIHTEYLPNERVVRCRDCRRSFEERGELWCRGIVGPPIEPDGFCAWASPRKEDES